MDEYTSKLESLIRGVTEDPIVDDVEEGQYCFFCGCSVYKWSRPKHAVQINNVEGYHMPDCWIIQVLDVLSSKQA